MAIKSFEDIYNSSLEDEIWLESKPKKYSNEELLDMFIDEYEKSLKFEQIYKDSLELKESERTKLNDEIAVLKRQSRKKYSKDLLERQNRRLDVIFNSFIEQSDPIGVNWISGRKEKMIQFLKQEENEIIEDEKLSELVKERRAKKEMLQDLLITDGWISQDDLK